MKSVLPAIVAILLACLPAGAAESPGPNLVADGGFEAGPWTPENDQQAAQVDLAVTHGGFQSGRLAAVPDRARWVYTVCPIQAPGSYLLSAWIRCEGVSNPRGVSMYLLEWSEGKSIGWLCREPGVKELIRTGGTHNWRRFAVLLPRLRPETRRAALYFATAAGDGRAWVDDVEVRAVAGDTLPAEYREPREEVGSRAVGAPSGASPAGEAVAARREPAPRVVCGPSIVRGGDFERIPATGSKPAGELDTAVKHGGAASLRVTGRNLPLLATEPVQAGDDYRFSVWVRTENVPRNGFSLRLWPGVWNEATMSEEQFRIGGTGEWTRHEITLSNLPAGLQGKTWYLYYDLQPSEGVRVWVDDAEIVPLQDTLRVTSARPGHFFTDAEPAALTVTARRLPPGAKRFVAYELTDFWGRPAGEGRAEVRPNADGTGSVRVPLKGRGYYRVDVALEDDGGRMLNQTITSAGVLPPPPGDAARLDPHSIFACWGGGNDLAPLLGIKWNRWMERATDFTPDPAKPGAYEWRLAEYYGPYDPEARCRKAAEAGVSTYLCFHNFPEWMRKRPDSSLAPVPTDWKLWADWVRFVYGPVKDVVSVVEVYNEPVIPWGWAGTPEEIVALHRATYQAVKSVNPKAVVLGPCDSELEHLDAFGRLGGFRWVDGIALHPYRPGSPEATDFVGYLRQVKTLLKRYDAPTDLWITEMGWTTAPGRFTEIQQANYVARTYVLALAEGVRHLNVHIFRDWNTSSASEKYFGIVRTDDTPKPAAVAYATLTRALGGAQYAGAIDWLGQTTQGHVFRREGRPVLVLWDAAQERTKASLPVDAPRVTVTRLDGRTEERDCPGGELSLELGESPVFVTGASVALYLAGPTRALSASPDPLTLAAGDTATVTVRVRNPRNEPLSAELLAETQEPCAVKPGRAPLNLKAGASVDVPLSVSLPANAAPRSFPLFLRLQQGDTCLARTAGRVEGIAPLAVEAVAPAFDGDGRAFVTARVANRSKQPARVSVALTGTDGEAALALQPGATALVRLPMAPARPDPSRRVSVTLRAANAAGGSVEAAKALNFTPCARARGPIAIDGDLSDWAGAVEARFGGDWPPMNPTIYRGEGDCAASFRTRWDARHWYLAVSVRDDVFRQTHTGSAVWQQDNIQVGLDPNPEGKAEFNPLVGFYGKALFEYGLTLTPKGPEAWRWLSGLPKSLPGEHAAPEVRLAVKRDGVRVTYEAAFPWASLGMKAPKPGGQMGLALAANDDDGEGRKAILWFDGIVHGKDPSLYGRVTFTE